MEKFHDIENADSVKSIDVGSFNEEEFQQKNRELQLMKDEVAKEKDDRLAELKRELDDGDEEVERQDKDEKENQEREEKHEKVESFIRDACSEPIAGINRVIPFRNLVDILVKGAEREGNEEVKKSILEGNVKDKRIYELKVYKKLLKRGFILPSDNRSYKNEQYHLGVDYTVKAGVEVRSIYDGKVVASGLDGGLGHRVIVEHSMPDGTKFYSLYAHLGSGNLPELGKVVKGGDIVGRVGPAFTPDNGDWEEHLHFQIMENPNSPKGYSGKAGEGNYDVLKSFGKE